MRIYACVVALAAFGCGERAGFEALGPAGVPGGVWRPLPTADAPSPRALHVAAWTGSELVVWGGLAPGRGLGAHLRDGARYDPVGDRWRSMDLSAAPAARSGATGTWTGSELLVFGGEDRYERAADAGAAYDPVRDRWRPLSAAGAPSPRLEHSAVWTGSEVVVFGGRDSVSALARGGAYDPATDRWRSLSTVDAPAARRLAGAAFTGREVLVYGGATYGPGQSTQEVPGGALYDPARDTWRPVSAAGAPHARAYFSLVPVGDVVLVLGEAGATRAAAYDPARDEWSPLPDDEALRGRGGLGAVWTGELVLLFGGMRLFGEAETAFGDGRLYSPKARRWLPLSLEDAPSARKYVTPVWTGSEAIVFGGADDLNVLGTGGAWRP